MKLNSRTHAYCDGKFFCLVSLIKLKKVFPLRYVFFGSKNCCLMIPSFFVLFRNNLHNRSILLLRCGLMLVTPIYWQIKNLASTLTKKNLKSNLTELNQVCFEKIITCRNHI
jgi:hypothetical protein